MIPSGKGIYVWELPNCARGDPIRLAAMAQEAGFSWLALKIQERDGVFTTNLRYLDGAIAALRATGIGVWGWGYIYPHSRLGQNIAAKSAAATVRLCAGYGVDGFIINAEKEWQDAKTHPLAEVYMAGVKAGAPNLSLGFSSFRYPTQHPLPWRTFLRDVDFGQQQVYWEGAHNPASQTFRSIDEWNAIVQKPAVPAGSAYAVGKWAATADDLDGFNAAVKTSKCPACLYWDWQHAEAVPEWWAAISRFTLEAQAPALTAAEKLERLWVHHAELHGV